MSIVLSHVRKAFGARTILDDVSLEVHEGETVAVIGYSGVGKSVLLKSIVRLLEPEAGTVLVDDSDVRELTRPQLYELRRKVGYVFQFAALFDSMSVFDNVAMGLRRIGTMPEVEVAQRVEDSLRLVEMSGYDDRMPGQLSGGQRKRVGLARAIATRPKYPLYTEDERMDFIATLGEWGCIVLNDGPGIDLIQSSMVDAVVVGSDWLARGGYLDQIGVDEEFLRSWDVSVIFVPSYAGITTSDIKRRVRDGH